MSKADLEMIIHSSFRLVLIIVAAFFMCLNKKDLDRLQLVQNAAATRKKQHSSFNLFTLATGIS